MRAWAVSKRGRLHSFEPAMAHPNCSLAKARRTKQRCSAKAVPACHRTIGRETMGRLRGRFDFLQRSWWSRKGGCFKTPQNKGIRKLLMAATIHICMWARVRGAQELCNRQITVLRIKTEAFHKGYPQGHPGRLHNVEYRLSAESLYKSFGWFPYSRIRPSVSDTSIIPKPPLKA